MSCEIKQFAQIADLKQVQEVLGFAQDENWLNAVYYALSPTAEVLAFAHGCKIVVLSNRWENQVQQYKYAITWSGVLENQNDIITSVVCLPIVGTNSSSSAEWTCIAIGLSTGSVQFYCDSGFELCTQTWHTEPVHSIKPQTGKKITEELHVTYETCVCIVSGQQLVQTLRFHRYQMQKGKPDARDSLPREPIPCRKWAYGGKNVTINDTAVVGAQKTNAFDHLLTASLEGGFHAKYKSAPPQSHLVLGAGVKPYIGFHCANEGYIQPVLADVARAVAGKIKSALPTWLTGSTQDSPTDPPPPPPIVSEPMSLRYGLCDMQRIAHNIWLAPNKRLAAVADNLGRIILVDCYRGIALRMWKGYRDAQCSFIRVAEKLPKNSDKIHRRHALFLVIFAPRRGTLEIWGLQRGGKVAAFAVSKHGQLVYNAHTLMGVTSSVKVKYASTTTCTFLDPSDLTLKEIIVPFHCAITDENSKTVKDMHLLRRIKLCLRSGDTNHDPIRQEVLESATNLQTNDIRLQCVEMMVKSHKVQPTLLKAVLGVFAESIAKVGGGGGEGDGVDEDITVEGNTADSIDDSDFTQLLLRQQLNSLVSNYTRLVDFYLYLTAVDPPRAVTDDTAEQCNSDDGAASSDSEFENIQKLIDLSDLERSAQSQPRVRFQDQLKSNQFTEFLAIFNCISDEGIILKDEQSSCFGTVGRRIFVRFLEQSRTMDAFLAEAEKTRLSSRNFARLLLQYWLEKPFLYSDRSELNQHLRNFTVILQQICAFADDKVHYKYNALSSWWQEIREMLLESPSALKALLAAMVCRNISAQYRQRENSNDDADDDSGMWEQVSQEAAQWSLLIGKLDDIAILSAVLSCSKFGTTPANTAANLTILPYSKPDVSLKAIVNGGRGIITELVAKWVAAAAISPSQLLETADDLDTSEAPNTEHHTFLHYFHMLRKHFPFSMNSGVLLGQLAWEYMCEWSKNMSNFNYFVSAMACLAAIEPAHTVIKHGLCCMIWNAHLKIPLEATKKLVNKAGRLPKEKVCQQEIGLPDVLLADFLEHCTVFLDHFAGCVRHAGLSLKFEELLQEGPVALASLAVQQNPANAELLHLHKQLNQVLFVITSLNVVHSKPVQVLFDGLANQSMFAEINRTLPYQLKPADVLLDRKRTEFLCIAIGSTMDLIREDLEQVFLDDHKLWMERIGDLAMVWNLDTNELKKYQIIELYNYGWDDYAEEQLEDVLDASSLGTPLLRIAGLRLNLYMINKPTVYAQVASFGQLLSSYLDLLLESDARLPNNPSTEDISLVRLQKLVGQTFKCLQDKENRELRVCGQLFDACATLNEDAASVE